MADSDHRDHQFLRELFDKAPLPYQSLDEDGCILRVNRAWLEALGYTEDEVVGRSIAEFLTDGSRALLGERFPRFKSKGKVSRVDFELVRKDGRVVPIELNGTIARSADGGFLRTHCIFMDVTEQRAAQRRLGESERRYRTLVEMAQEGIWQIDKDAVTVYVNPSMAAMLGCEPAEMIGRHFFEFLDERGRKKARRELARREQGIAEIYDIELIGAKGRRLDVTVAARPLYDDAGDYSGTIAGVIDMTHRRRLEQKMLHAHKLESLELMAGGIAHDFNNLLQTILGNADLALMNGGQDAQTRGALESITKAGRQAADLCRQMLAYAGRGVYAMETLRLDELVLDVDALLRATITRKADLRYELSSEVPPVHADPAQLRQVVVNMVTNAAEALHDSPGSIVVAVRAATVDAAAAERDFPADRVQPGEFVVLEVRDDGCGMPREHLDSIFDPFYSTKFTGRGLGLAVVKGVARAHGGGVTVRSEEGRGSAFALWLPAAPAATATVGGRRRREAAEPPPLPDATPADPAEGDGRPTVLVADDDAELRELVLRMLGRLGWHAEGVADGAAAVQALAERPDRYELVLLDWSMPVMDGREALEAIRAAAPDLPVFMSSGYGIEALAAEVAHLRPTGFLVKPYRMAELRRILAAWSPDGADAPES